MQTRIQLLCCGVVLAGLGTFAVAQDSPAARSTSHVVQSAPGGAPQRPAGLTKSAAAAAPRSTVKRPADVNFTVLHDFAGGTADGATSWSSPIQAFNGDYYGVTETGGTNNTGIVYHLTKDGTFTVIHSFAAAGSETFPEAGLLQASDGYLYGTTCGGNTNSSNHPYPGTLFRIGLDGSNYQVVHNFAQNAGGVCPLGAPIQGTDGLIYGSTGFATTWVTTYPASAEGGTVWTYNISTGAFNVLHTFSSGPGGHGIQGPLVEGSDGIFYGTTRYVDDPSPCSDQYGCGTVFSLSKGGTFEQIYVVDSTSTADQLSAGLVEGNDGQYYSTSLTGGSNAWGNVTQSSLEQFDGGMSSFYNGNIGGPQMAIPFTGRLQVVNDTMYGASEYGGSNVSGDVYSIDTNGNYTELYEFSGSDGQNPYAHPIADDSGNLIGTTYNGGSGSGVVYSISGVANPPVQLFANGNATAGTPTYMFWNVSQGNSKTANNCYAYSPNSKQWSGQITGSGSTYITEPLAGTYTYELNCGGTTNATATTIVAPGAGGTITLTTTAHDFGVVNYGGTQVFGLGVTNSGSTSVAFGATLSGSSNFVIYSNSCGTTIKPGATCQVAVRYTAPTAAESDTATINITSGAGVNITPGNAVSLRAQSAAGGTVTISTVKHNFGGVTVGTSQVFGLRVANGSPSNLPFAISVASSSGTGITISNGCGSTLKAGAACYVNFTYAPTSKTNSQVTVNLSASGASFSPSNTVQVLGYGQ